MNLLLKVFPPAKVISIISALLGVRILTPPFRGLSSSNARILKVTEDARASIRALVELFERFKCLEVYTQISLITKLALVKIMIELLSIAANEMERQRSSKRKIRHKL